MAALSVDNVTKQFPARSGPLDVLRGITLQLTAGENLAIIGPSGSGKSTLLHILGTLDRPTTGTVRLDGEDPFRLAEPQLADFRNRQIGFVFQDHHLLQQCTVLENVLLPAIARRGAAAEMVERARGLVQRVGLADRADHRPAELSGGERQRVAVARALLHRPALLLADEPTGNLDRRAAAGVADLLLEMQHQEKAILIVVTHNLELADRMDRVSALEDGWLTPRGS